LLAWSVLSLFGKNEEHYYDIADVNLVAGETYSIDDISLNKGTYRLRLHYQTDVDYSNACNVSFDAMGYKGGYCNGTNLFAGKNETDVEMWVLRDTNQITVTASANAGSLQLHGLMIRQTNAMSRMNLFALCAFLLVVNTLYVLFEKDKAGRITVQQKAIGCLLGGVVLLSSLPLMVDGIYSSGDIGYHLMRIEGVKDGILSGQFPVRIAPNWQQGNGYADAVFYCELFLLPAALLRMIGFTVTTSYRIYILIMNIATTAVSYVAFSKVFKNRYAGVFCSALYTLSLYRFVMTYVVGGLGETSAMLWLPLFVLGFEKIYCDDTATKQYKWSWIPLAVAFSGMICSHMLGCELVGGFTILLCIILWRKTFEKERFIALAKTVVGFLILTAWFWVPFADYMLTGDFMIQHASGRTIQERGLYLAHLFNPIFFAGGEVFIDETGMQNSLPMGVGIGLMLVAAVWLVMAVIYKKECDERELLSVRERNMGNILFAFSVVAMIMSLNVFPWNYLHSMNGVFASLVSSLQRPYRVLTIANILLVALAGLLYKVMEKFERKWLVASFVAIIGSVSLFVTLFATSDFMFSDGMVRIYNSEGMGTGYIAGAEYLPYGVDASKLTYHNPIATENIVVEGFEKGALSRRVNCHNMTMEDGNVAVDLLYYKGYKAIDTDSGEELEVFSGQNGLVTVNVPVGYDGVIEIAFVSPWYWRLAEVISLVSAIGMVLLYRRDKKKLIMQKEA